MTPISIQKTLVKRAFVKAKREFLKLFAMVIITYFLPAKQQRNFLMLHALDTNLWWHIKRGKVVLPGKNSHYEPWQRSYFRYLVDYWYQGGGSHIIPGSTINIKQTTQESIRNLCQESIRDHDKETQEQSED